MPQIPWTVHVTQHGGSTEQDLIDEPDWTAGHEHHIGFYNSSDRKPGYSNVGDDVPDESEEEEALESYRELQHEAKEGDLINFREIIEKEKDIGLGHPKNRNLGYRYRVNASEDWVKKEEEWPANIQKKKKKQEEQKEQEEQEKKKQKRAQTKKQPKKRKGADKSDGAGGSDKENEKPQEEHEWKRSEGENKHHDAYAAGSGSEEKPEDDKKADGKDEHDQGQKGKDEENQKPPGHENDEDKSDDSKQQDHSQDGKQSDQKHDDEKKDNRSEDEKLRDKYSPQEIALLKMLQWEAKHVKNLKQNDGKGISPVKDRNRTAISIDEADQFTPDNWIPRSSDLIRLTGKHPLNAEADLTRLYDAGLITPNELHYVRCHGAVPYIMYEFHNLEIENEGHEKLTLSMDDIKSRFDPINIPVALACDGNRRKELALKRKVKGFAWGAGAVSCAYWKGALLRDVLIAAGVPDHYHDTLSHSPTRYYVHFEGADEPSEGKYSTCIPLQYAMDPTNDVILAYEMNNLSLPPDHGYPLRLMIPGYVGGRCVKWLAKIWVNQKENDTYYHIWDNRVLPSFVTEKDGEFAETLFRHPDTACNEQNLNSVITKPAQGERIALKNAIKGKTYRVEGYAYDGGGHEVQRVELSLDDGETWLYCCRIFPDAPIRHGNKYWAWIHWHLDIELTHLINAKSIICRCFNVFKNTQPKDLNWNIMGMMNNAWYTLKTEITTSDNEDSSGEAQVLFRHPAEPGTGDGGWMKPSVENQIAQTKREAGTPTKQFTREEIEKHSDANDCWIVVDGKVYDATSVLGWHPGGSAAILGHAGKCHQDTSEEFASIHDDFAYQKLKECILGVVSPKAASFIKQTAEARAKELAEAGKNKPKDVALEKHRWVPVTLESKRELSKDTRAYTFRLPKGKPDLGLGTCQHVKIGFHFKDRMIIRAYTPSAPLLPPTKEDEKQNKNQRIRTEKSEKGKPVAKHSSKVIPTVNRDSGEANDKHGSNGKEIANEGEDSNNEENPDEEKESQDPKSKAAALRDASGTFELTVKTYFPTDAQPGGALSNILDTIPLGEQVEMLGPTGDIIYHGYGDFTIEGREVHFDRVSLILGGSGITPGYALIARILLAGVDLKEGQEIQEGAEKDNTKRGKDRTEIRVIDANKTEGDILLWDELKQYEKQNPEQLKITYVLSHPSDEWKGEKGHVNEEIIKKGLFPPRNPRDDEDDEEEEDDDKDENKDEDKDENKDEDKDENKNEDKDKQKDDANQGPKSVVFLCGPPAMIQKAALPALRDWGYEEEVDCFGF